MTAARKICTVTENWCVQSNTSLVIINICNAFPFMNVCKLATWFCKDVEAACISQQHHVWDTKLQMSKNL